MTVAGPKINMVLILNFKVWHAWKGVLHHYKMSVLTLNTVTVSKYTSSNSSDGFATCILMLFQQFNCFCEPSIYKQAINVYYKALQNDSTHAKNDFSGRCKNVFFKNIF